MKTLFTFLLSGMFMFLLHSNAAACSLNPTAVIDIYPDDVVFLEGDSILFEGYASSANCGTITAYRWRLDGVTVSTSGEYIANLSLPAGQSSQTFDVQLRVRNSAGKYGYKTVKITIARSHKSYYYLTDHLGSVRVTVNDAGDPVGWDDYYPFGLQMPGRTQNESNPNDDSKFTGYLLEQNGELGIYHAEARMYDPVLGRFMQVDPLADDPMQVHLTPYNYTWNNPILLSDPDGRCPSCLVGAVAGGFLDVAFQMAVEGKSLTEVDLVSVGISAAAGATGAGFVSGVNKLRKAGKVGKAAQIVGEGVTDGVVSAGEQVVREGEVDLVNTTSAVLLGQGIRSPLRDKVTRAGQTKVNDAQKSARKANRLAKSAKNKSTRPGKIEARQNAANQAKKEAVNAEKRNQLKGVAAGASAAGTARKTIEEKRKDEN